LEKVAMTNYKRLKIDGAVYFFTLVLNDRIGSNLLIAEFNQLKESIKKVKANFKKIKRRAGDLAKAILGICN